MSGLFVPCMVTVDNHVYIYWFAQGLWGIWRNGFLEIAVELFPSHHWQLFLINVWICGSMQRCELGCKPRLANGIHVTYAW